MRACKQLEDRNRPLSTLIMESLEKDLNGTLRAVSSFVPKEHLVGGDEDNPVKTVNEIRITLVDTESGSAEEV